MRTSWLYTRALQILCFSHNLSWYSWTSQHLVEQLLMPNLHRAISEYGILKHLSFEVKKQSISPLSLPFLSFFFFFPVFPPLLKCYKHQRGKFNKKQGLPSSKGIKLLCLCFSQVWFTTSNLKLSNVKYLNFNLNLFNLIKWLIICLLWPAKTLTICETVQLMYIQLTHMLLECTFLYKCVSSLVLKYWLVKS